jgi:hypothetical protein
MNTLETKGKESLGKVENTKKKKRNCRTEKHSNIFFNLLVDSEQISNNKSSLNWKPDQ